MDNNLILISERELEQRAGCHDCMVIDLREPGRYRAGHLPGAVNLPFEDYDRWSGRLPRTKTLILYCERGGSALQAGRRLARIGYRVEVVSGGYHPK
ncbi:MAG: rhodanese-like domain-containing protein [Lachnospiraceae bacterium]|nr:rhodanese-like domain-containing protein [Lachnospiraceae bacterium]